VTTPDQSASQKAPRKTEARRNWKEFRSSTGTTVEILFVVLTKNI